MFRVQTEVERLRLPAGKADAFVWDGECTGLSVRLQGKRRTYVVWYTVNGTRRRVSLGDVAGMRLQDARRRATEIVNGAKDGKDVLGDRVAARARAEDSLGRLITVYLERRAKPRQRPKSFAETRRALMNLWAPLHSKEISSITRRDIAERLEHIRVERGPTAAKNARAYLSALFSWAIKDGFAEHNPAAATTAPEPGPTRARVLDPEEIRLIWRACGGDDFGRIVKLLLLTGQRRTEVGSMAWAEIDLARRLWVIPEARTKNKREHEVPLADQAIALLPERRPGREHVFGRGPDGFTGFSHAKAQLDAKLGLRPWRLHDIRHSFVTHAHELGIEPHIVEALVNHRSGFKAGIAGRYNAALYRDPKRAAMERWAAWLKETVNVV